LVGGSLWLGEIQPAINIVSGPPKKQIISSPCHL